MTTRSHLVTQGAVQVNVCMLWGTSVALFLPIHQFTDEVFCIYLHSGVDTLALACRMVGMQRGNGSPDLYLVLTVTKVTYRSATKETVPDAPRNSGSTLWLTSLGNSRADTHPKRRVTKIVQVTPESRRRAARLQCD